MRALRVPMSGLEAGDRVLDAETFHYVARVRRLSVGGKFVLFDAIGRLEADAELVSVRGDRAVCRIGTVRPAEPSGFSMTLVQCIGKGDKVDRVIRDATALGVSRIVVAESRRSVPRLGDRAAARRQRWQTIAIQAARQSGRGDLPEIVGPELLASVLAQSNEAALRVILVREADPLVRVLRADQGRLPVVMLVGPEGGFDSGELERARQAGFIAASLGPFVLRTETAAVAALGALMVHRLAALPTRVGGQTSGARD